MGTFLIAGNIFCLSSGAQSAAPYKTQPELEAYLQENSTGLRRNLRDYNREHEIVASGTGRTWKIMNFHWDIQRLDGDVVFLEIQYQVGDAYGSERGRAVFELAWSDDGLNFITHYQELPEFPPASQTNPIQAEETAAIEGATAAPPNSAATTDALNEQRRKVEAYLEANDRQFRRRLGAYNKEHRIALSNSSLPKVRSYKWSLESAYGNQVTLAINFAWGSFYNNANGNALFDLEWRDGELFFVTHYAKPAGQEIAQEVPQTAAAPSQSQTELPEEDRAKVGAYLESNERDFGLRLAAYNRKHRIAISNDPLPKLRTFDWKITRIEGDQVTLGINFVVGNDWNPANGRALFDLEWRDGNLVFRRHRPWKKDPPKDGGVLADSTERGCIYNYYSHRPCIDTIRKWREFAEFNDLELNPQSAQIFQAYKHDQFTTGDRLLARARGLPDPTGETVFGLQSEITALNLRQYQLNDERPCDLNPFGPKPCPQIARLFRDFAARHGLKLDRRTGNMFEAYANGDFRKADVIYALAKNLPVPAYGYIPTGIADDTAIAALLARPTPTTKIECENNPYRTRPCPGALRAWQEFAERYGLEDNAGNAQIFQAYTEGEFREADQLFAQAKGVSIEQLHEAAGVPSKGLVIEVYPGAKGASGS